MRSLAGIPLLLSASVLTLGVLARFAAAFVTLVPVAGAVLERLRLAGPRRVPAAVVFGLSGFALITPALVTAVTGAGAVLEPRLWLWLSPALSAVFALSSFARFALALVTQVGAAGAVLYRSIGGHQPILFIG
jgi:hypothetical protein